MHKRTKREKASKTKRRIAEHASVTTSICKSRNKLCQVGTRLCSLWYTLLFTFKTLSNDYMQVIPYNCIPTPYLLYYPSPNERNVYDFIYFTALSNALFIRIKSMLLRGYFNFRLVWEGQFLIYKMAPIRSAHTYRYVTVWSGSLSRT